MELIATRPMIYGTRRLMAGDTFTAPSQTARVLIAINKAKAHSKDPLPKKETSLLAALRSEYHNVVGKRPFNGWDAETLRAKIAEAKDAN